MRGNLLLRLLDLPADGSIPAHAGKPLAPNKPDARIRVYPRACGETLGRGRKAPAGQGLSPRMRGNQLTFDFSCLNCGSIPAHAGKPAAQYLARRAPGVYPRACGETICAEIKAHPEWGLSPRMRGNQTINIDQDAGLGSIPAHAGKPVLSSCVSLGIGVYPRACGETDDDQRLIQLFEGLSPRMRGNQAP